jgi:hypothetical protein
VAAEIILHNAKIATNSNPSFVEALAIAGGKIVATGSAREIFQMQGPAARVIDAKGRAEIKDRLVRKQRLSDGSGHLKVLADEHVVRPTDLDHVDGV